MKSLFLLIFFTSSVLYSGSKASTKTFPKKTKSLAESLTPPESQALKEWQQTKPSSNAPSTSNQNGQYQGTGAVLSQNISGGNYIELGDNSMWKINPEDTLITGSWISPVMINVQSNPDSNWPYLLTNSATESKARAQSIDKLPPSQGQAPSSIPQIMTEE